MQSYEQSGSHIGVTKDTLVFSSRVITASCPAEGATTAESIVTAHGGRADAVRYNYKKPAEWDGLMEFAAGAVDPQLEHNQQREAASAIWDYAESAMGPEIQENNRYYGMGRVICGFAQEVMNPESRALLVASLIDEVTASHEVYCSSSFLSSRKGLYVKEIGGGAFNTSAAPLVAPSYSAIPVAERLAINVLAGLAAVNPEYRPASKDEVLEQILAAKIEPALESSVTNALGGAAATYKAALDRIYEQQSGVTYDAKIHNPPIAVIADEAAINALDLTKVTPVTAGKLRIDEAKHMTDYVRVREDGTVYVDRKSIPQVPPPLSVAGQRRPGSTHENRIGCPALFIPGLVQLATGMMPEVINGAQRKLLPDGPAGVTYDAPKPYESVDHGDENENEFWDMLDREHYGY